MRKNQARILMALAIILLVFSIIVFSIPNMKNEVFYCSYLCGVFSIVIQIYVLKTSFHNEDSVKSKFYGFPIAQIGIVYMCIQLVLSLIFICLSAIVPLTLVIAVDIILFAVAALGFIGTDAMRDEIEQLDNKMETDTSCIMTLRSLVYALTTQCSNKEGKKALLEISDEFRYSDPVSSKTLETIEKELEEAVMQLQKMVDNDDTEQIMIACRKVSNILGERNRLCKLNKK